MVTKRAAATEKENDVVARTSKKRSRAVVTPPPGQSSSASGGVDNTQVEGKPPVASSSPPLIDIINTKTSPSASPPSQVASSPLSASPPLVDLKQDSDDSEEQVVNFQDEGTANSYFEWQAHHFPTASSLPTKKKRGRHRLSKANAAVAASSTTSSING